MTEARLYHIPQEPKRLHAIGLAALVHIGLFAFLWLGINWQNEKPIAIEAEIWNMPPTPKPLPSPEKPAPVLTPTKQTISEKIAPAINPNIALEQIKKRQAEEKSRLLKQQIAQEKAKKAAQVEKEKAQKLAAEKLAEKKRQQAEEERIAKRNIEAEKQKKARNLKLEQELAEKKARDDEMHRITNAIHSGTTGRIDAPKSTGNKRGDPSYIQMIAAKIKSNTQFYLTADVTSNNPVEYKIELFPDGSLRGLPQKLKSSGIPGFDEAVRRAIEKSVPLPPDNSGTVPSSLTITHRPKD